MKRFIKDFIYDFIVYTYDNYIPLNAVNSVFSEDFRRYVRECFDTVPFKDNITERDFIRECERVASVCTI